MTPTQDPIIDTLGNNVIVASGGSYHMAKFLPTIGKFVVAKIYEQSPLLQKSRWSITEDRFSACQHQPYLVPGRDLHDLSIDKGGQ